ncbi:MAG: sigma-70 family RNA polymerase sigma factor [Limnochordia bacterium]|jgi:RNA polymerase sporulation-specific sigma factor|nr:sigma-70 family RNA polymerase sigma factor [Limnochordia bacterium]MDI9464850.1 sigma-70 family RNA polymerase sigma factor [Bacillota bacterium]NLO95633.1 sigma-70 family RNA polymerase sigma factor [Bacillota bacterium]HAN94240.1 RNA polymerase sporulation sigma factor SigH [Bacillota bacterium]HOB39756.1 sigma-70 family RNA polymerase sigma factor [Limnochordia bacterium]
MQRDNQAVDLELIRRVRAGEEGARESLVLKYIPMVKYIIRNYYSSFLDFEDLVQEGLIGLLSAIEEYKPERYDVKFSSFAYLCIIRRVYNVIKQSTGNKHRLLNEAASLQTPVGSDDGRTMLDFVAAPLNQFDPEKVLEEKYVDEVIGQVLRNHLSLLEYAVISRLLKGYSAREIEEEIGVGLKVIDNARTRVRAKLRRLLEEYGSLLSPQVPTDVRRREDLYLQLPLGR